MWHPQHHAIVRAGLALTAFRQQQTRAGLGGRRPRGHCTGGGLTPRRQRPLCNHTAMRTSRSEASQNCANSMV